ncbi:hypothetical protein AU210_016490 [Fusarium oxysporum f. sp. radicis-cucumerinum]|nr:hypothetical protein AU210_016490 [Fusarium oxysporum f. sp. radicis-cucumerinum]
MDKFRQIPDYFISRGEEICDKLIFDIKPDIGLAAMKDDMVNMSSGYSFVKHPANDLDKAYLGLLYSGSNVISQYRDHLHNRSAEQYAAEIGHGVTPEVAAWILELHVRDIENFDSFRQTQFLA